MAKQQPTGISPHARTLIASGVLDIMVVVSTISMSQPPIFFASLIFLCTVCSNLTKSLAGPRQQLQPGTHFK